MSLSERLYKVHSEIIGDKTPIVSLKFNDIIVCGDSRSFFCILFNIFRDLTLRRFILAVELIAAFSFYITSF